MSARLCLALALLGVLAACSRENCYLADASAPFPAGCGPCPTDVDVGQGVGQVATGTTAAMKDDFSPSGDCSAAGGNDVSHKWTAPDSGTYQFDTMGSGADTILYAFDETCGDIDGEAFCNDDTNGVQSLLTFSVSRGEIVVLVVDTGIEGSYVLNINKQQ